MFNLVNKIWYKTLNTGVEYDGEYVIQPVVSVFNTKQNLSVETMLDKLSVLENVSVFEIGGDVFIESLTLLDELELAVFFEQLEDVLMTF